MKMYFEYSSNKSYYHFIKFNLSLEFLVENFISIVAVINYIAVILGTIVIVYFIVALTDWDGEDAYMMLCDLGVMKVTFLRIDWTD